MSRPELGSGDHLSVADRFYAMALKDKDATDPERPWVVVFYFYAAVHWLRAYIRFKSPGRTISSHDDVKDLFDVYPEMKRIRVPYDTLKQASQAVRYYGESYPDYTAARQYASRVQSWVVSKCKPQ